jgi:Spy/CpxP family protein refolding chaperone
MDIVPKCLIKPFMLCAVKILNPSETWKEKLSLTFGGHMKRTLVVGFGILILSALLVAQPKAGREMRHGDMRDLPLKKLNLTDDQKAQLKKVRFDVEKREIELKSKVELSRLELRNLLMADAPDQSAIKKKIEEVAMNESALHVNKLNGWFEANKLMNPEQQKIWLGVLRQREKAQAHMKGMRRGNNMPSAPMAPPAPKR